MNLDKEFKLIQDKVDNLQKVADTVIQPPMKLEKYTDHKNKKYQYSLYGEMFGTFDKMCEYYFWSGSGWGKKEVTRESLEEAINTFNQAIEHWKHDNKETYEYNQKAITHNKLQFERLETIMKTLNVPTKFHKSYFKTARSKSITHETSPSQWPEEVKKCLPMDCGWGSIIKTMEDKLEKVIKFGEKWIKDNDELLRKEKVEKEVKEKQERKVKTLAGLCAKYALDFESGAHTIQMSIINKDKYLHLAYYLEKNREDWTEGYNYAEEGLEGFTIESDQDKEIYEEISGLINNDDSFVDGRVFRDCKWNYSLLFSMADKELYKDYNLINEFIGGGQDE